MVGDGDAMGIAGQVMQHMLWTAEGWLGINDPVLVIKCAQEDGEALLFLERPALAEEAQLMAGKEAPQSGDELAAEDAAEHLDRQQEAGTGSDPARVVGGEPATRHHAVDVRMWSECLSPGVQNGQEAKLCAEMPGIGSDVEQRGGTGLEQQGKQLPLVLPHQRHKRMWDAEDEMIVADGQQFLLSLRQPLIARADLAFRAVPVAAGVIRDGLMSAAQARIAMTTERSGTAAHDRIHHLALRPGQRGAVLLPEAVTTDANDVGHLEGRSAHRFLSPCP